ncbi:glycosyltransferase family 4 protein [Demequina salsinemoris]|uniref:glycosyltransferase family 4 protein n=1 Tax=Demequina salsinemoris TaxID=577470 RepID=UPI0007855A90|nr:glycosyltransferase family 1 protein [Demequina salsinemoris]
MPRRKLVVDLLGFTGARGGTETHVRELLPRVSALLHDTEIITLTGRAGAAAVREFAPGELRVLRSVGPGKASWAWGALAAVPRIAARLDADLLWCPANFGPVSGRVPTVLSVHDAIYRSVPGTGIDRVTRRAIGALVAGAARRATTVLTVSEAARLDIEQHLGVERDRIVVVPNGASKPPATPTQGARERLGLPTGRPIVMSIGNPMPHKNLAGLVRAVAAVPPDTRPYAVIVGEGVPESLRLLVAELDVGSDVTLLGWVEGEVLEDVYAAADMYACVSLSEGFGLPVVDAMQRSVAVLANDIPVLREVGGDAAVYADARDPKAFARALVTLHDDPDELSNRRASGLRRARRFDWQTTSVGIANVLLSALSVDP